VRRPSARPEVAAIATTNASPSYGLSGPKLWRTLAHHPDAPTTQTRRLDLPRLRLNITIDIDECR